MAKAKLYLTVNEAAKVSGKTPGAIHYWCNFKGLRVKMMDAGWGRPQKMISEADLRKFLEKKGG